MRNLLLHHAAVHFWVKNFMLVYKCSEDSSIWQWIFDGLKVVLPVLVDNIWRFLSHYFYYGEGCPMVDGFVCLTRFIDTRLFVAIAPACFNVLIWKLLCKLLLFRSTLRGSKLTWNLIQTTRNLWISTDFKIWNL